MVVTVAEVAFTFLLMGEKWWACEACLCYSQVLLACSHRQREVWKRVELSQVGYEELAPEAKFRPELCEPRQRRSSGPCK